MVTVSGVESGGCQLSGFQGKQTRYFKGNWEFFYHQIIKIHSSFLKWQNDKREDWKSITNKKRIALCISGQKN